jgi:AbrB family looped-hinge helix DNA binding protein
MATADLRERNQVTLPMEIRKALHIEIGDRLEFRIADDGQVLVRGLKSIPADQAWYWTPQWQAKELEADTAQAIGDKKVFQSIADMDAWFDSLDSNS